MIMWYAQVTDRSRPMRFGVIKVRISASVDVHSVSPHISGLETMRSLRLQCIHILFFVEDRRQSVVRKHGRR